jgi:hypothetical protein
VEEDIPRHALKEALKEAVKVALKEAVGAHSTMLNDAVATASHRHCI